MKLSEINIRDPYILCDNDRYYLYGSRGQECWGECTGLDVYTSDDLLEWSEPRAVFKKFDGFWATKHYWAPEVHKYKGNYYMLVSFKSDKRNRGTQILKSNSPLGPFVPHSDGPITPKEWSCLDGTLYVENEIPYMVFCHEWTQIRDGEMCIVRLTDDLKAPAENPRVLFRASELPYGSDKLHNGFITDGPFVYKLRNGKLAMLWSSFDENGYVEAISVSDSGNVNGKWEHCIKPLSAENGGHGMLFKDKQDIVYFTMHSPNKPKYAERVKLLRIREIEQQPFFEFV